MELPMIPEGEIEIEAIWFQPYAFHPKYPDAGVEPATIVGRDGTTWRIPAVAWNPLRAICDAYVETGTFPLPMRISASPENYKQWLREMAEVLIK